jgi:hypothetical protein
MSYSRPFRATALLAAALILPVACCRERLAIVGVEIGMSATEVEWQLGVPEVISESSGDQTRFTAAASPRGEAWREVWKREYFYMTRDVVVEFRSDRVHAVSKIDSQVRFHILEPLHSHTSR